MDVLNIIYCWFAELEPAIWVALFALTLSIVVAFQNWKHNRLSVLPNVDLHRNIGSGRNSVTIISSGIGPVIIEEIKIEINNKSYIISTLKGMNEFYKQYNNMLLGFKVLEKGIFLLPGDSESILILEDFEVHRIKGFLSEITFSIKWKSVYGQKFDAEMKNIHETYK